MAYVDGFLLVVPKKKINAYRKLAAQAAPVFRKYGALEVKECVADDLKAKFGVPFPKLVKPKAGETIVFSWIIYKSKAARDRANAKMMKDPEMANMDPKTMPFDMKRMSYGGFRIIVDA
jgi:alkaline phosphatase